MKIIGFQGHVRICKANTYIRGRRQSNKYIQLKQTNKRDRTRQLYETTEKRDQQSNDKQRTADSERAVDSRARGKQSKRKDIKKNVRQESRSETR